MSLSHVVWYFLSSNLVLLFCQKTVEDFIPIETLFNQNFSKQIIKKQTYKKRKETNKQKCKKQVSRLKKKRTKDKKFSRGVIMSDVTHRKALRELLKKLRVEIWEKGMKLEIDSNSCLFLLVKKKKKKTRLKLMDLSCHFDVLKKESQTVAALVGFFSFLFFLFIFLWPSWVLDWRMKGMRLFLVSQR